MRKLKIFTAALVAVSLTSCANSGQGRIVKQKYVHKYGIEVPSEDWSSRGEDGQVITTLADGVTVTNQYARGNLHGETTYTFPYSDTIERVEVYDNSRPVKEIVNNENGWPQKEVRYLSGNRREITNWFESSSPQSVETYEGKRLVTGEYYTSSNQLESRVDNGEGLRIVRDFYGTHIYNEQIAGGFPALRLTYHPNGVLKSETPYARGVIEGTRQTYMPSGEPQTTESWIGGKQHGLTVIYKNGMVWKEIPYVDGQKEGIEKVYRNGKDIVEEITWFEGKKHGPHRKYIENVVKTDWFYKDGAMPRPKKDQYISQDNY